MQSIIPPGDLDLLTWTRSALLTLALTVAGADVAVAAEPIFPAGSSVGIVPPREMAVSARFKGFEGPAGTSVVLTEMPGHAYAQLHTGFTLERLRPQGFSSVERQEVQVAGRDSLLLSGEQTVGGLTVRKWIVLTATAETVALVVATMPKGDTTYRDEELRAAVLSTAIRPSVSLDDKVAALPFEVRDRAGFRIVPVVVGNGLILTEGPKDSDSDGSQPSIVVAASFGPAPATANADSFGRRALMGLNSLRDVVVDEARTFEQGGDTWHELLARATDAKSGLPVSVLQTIRFGDAGYLRVIATAPGPQREALLPRFRRLAASVGPRSTP